MQGAGQTECMPTLAAQAGSAPSSRPMEWPRCSTTSAVPAFWTRGACSRGGTLVCYGTASTLDQPGNPRLPVAKLLARLFAWNVLPNGRHAHFFNLWAGRRLRPRQFRAQLPSDLRGVLGLLAEDAITPTDRVPVPRSPRLWPLCATPRPATLPARSCSSRRRDQLAVESTITGGRSFPSRR